MLGTPQDCHPEPFLRAKDLPECIGLEMPPSRLSGDRSEFALSRKTGSLAEKPTKCMSTMKIEGGPSPNKGAQDDSVGVIGFQHKLMKSTRRLFSLFSRMLNKA
jgi:hypothetical protein